MSNKKALLALREAQQLLRAAATQRVKAKMSVEAGLGDNLLPNQSIKLPNQSRKGDSKPTAKPKAGEREAKLVTELTKKFKENPTDEAIKALSKAVQSYTEVIRKSQEEKEKTKQQVKQALKPGAKEAPAEKGEAPPAAQAPAPAPPTPSAAPAAPAPARAAQPASQPAAQTGQRRTQEEVDFDVALAKFKKNPASREAYQEAMEALNELRKSKRDPDIVPGFV